MADGTADWPRLGSVIEQRMDELNLTQSEVQARGGPSPAKVREIVNGRSTVLSPSKRRDLERALSWRPGSIDLVLAGGEPTAIQLGDNLHQLIPVGPARADDHSASEPITPPTQDDSTEALILGPGAKILADSQLETADSMLDLLATLDKDDAVHREFAPRLLAHLDDVFDLLDRTLRFLRQGDYAGVQSRARRAHQRAGAQRLRLGLSDALSEGDSRSRVERSLNAMSAAQEEALADAEDRAEARREPSAADLGPDRWPDGQPVYDEDWEQWKAWRAAGEPEDWELYRSGKQSDVEAVGGPGSYRIVPGPTDKERFNAAQDADAEAPDPAAPDDRIPPM